MADNRACNIVIMATHNYGSCFSANNTKCEFIALGLTKIGCKVTIINQLTGIEGNSSVQKCKSDAGVNYINFPKCKFFKITNNLRLLNSILKGLSDPYGLNHIIVGFNYYPLFLLICFIAHKRHYTRSTLFHEWHMGIKGEPIHRRFDYFLVDSLFGYSLDYIFPISHFLENKAKRFKRPMALLPVMSSYDRVVRINNASNYFSFCANGLYLLRNSLILDAFRIVVRKYPNIQLKLILFGSNSTIDKVRDLIYHLGIQDNVFFESQVSQERLYDIFDGSIGLLIPLQPNSLQDVARFSQKIAEYVGSKRPIITSSVGEIPYYFKHKESAMIAEYSPEGYAHCMEELLLDPLLADKIGQNGYLVGVNNFDAVLNANKILNLIRNK